MLEILKTVKEFAELPLVGVLGLLVYLLGRKVAKLEVMVIECLQSGGKVSEKTVASLDDL